MKQTHNFEEKCLARKLCYSCPCILPPSCSSLVPPTPTPALDRFHLMMTSCIMTEAKLVAMEQFAFGGCPSDMDDNSH